MGYNIIPPPLYAVKNKTKQSSSYRFIYLRRGLGAINISGPPLYFHYVSLMGPMPFPISFAVLLSFPIFIFFSIIRLTLSGTGTLSKGSLEADE
tara:strand:- start:314 stop:595 length:282 start_codon:yes stop_codon:yes gene_type:complete